MTLPLTLLTALLLKSLLVCAAAGVLLLALRRSSAAARHLACLWTLAALLALPLFSLTLPTWHLPVLSAAAPSVKPVAATEFPPAPNNGGVGTANTEAAPTVAPAVRPALASFSAPPLLGAGGNSFLWPLVCVAFYVFGFLLASLRPLLGLWGIRRLRQSCAAVTDAPTLGVFAECARLLGVSPPCLYQADVPVPMTWGWRRPVVVLTPSAADWPEGRLRSVLLHEMAHVKRRDWPGHRVADLACAVYWFHPLVWLVARRLRAESEAACDDIVLASGIPAPDYARHLLAIAQTLSPATRLPHSAIAMAQTSRIERRLHMILNTTQSRRALTRRVLLAALVPSAAALITLAVLRPSVKAQNASEEIQSYVMTSARHQMTLTNATAILTSMPPALPGFQKTFSHGIKVTLNAVTQGPIDKGSWWQPNGMLLSGQAKTFHDHFRGWPKTSHPISFLFTVNAPYATAYSKASQFLVAGKAIEPVFNIDIPMRTQNSGPSETAMNYEFPQGARFCSLRYGIASGPWKTIAAQKVSFTSDTVQSRGATSDQDYQGDVTIELSQHPKLQYKGTDGTIHAVPFLMHPLGEVARRILAVDKNGVATRLYISTGGRDSTQIGLAFSSRSVLHRYNSEVDLTQIRELRLQTRPYEWTEFKDVALQPVK